MHAILKLPGTRPATRLRKPPLLPKLVRQAKAETVLEYDRFLQAQGQSLARREGPLSLPTLERISPKKLSALLEKEDVEIPLIETLELIPEPDGTATDDFVIPEEVEERQRRQRAKRPATGRGG